MPGGPPPKTVKKKKREKSNILPDFVDWLFLGVVLRCLARPFTIVFQRLLPACLESEDQLVVKGQDPLRPFRSCVQLHMYALISWYTQEPFKALFLHVSHFLNSFPMFFSLLIACPK